jgi:hypothetical protein
MEDSVPGRKKKRARKSYRSSGTPGSTSTSVDLAGTWMREEGGVVQQLVVSKTDAIWLGPWEFSQSGGDWATMTESLVKNLTANNMQVDDDGDFLRVV